jgi:hypothetical protein
MDKGTRNALIIIVLIIVVVLAIFTLPKGESAKYSNLDAFAQCLTDKGVKMYGAYWCPHCKSQKELFGSSFSKVDYVECTDKVKECEAAGVTSYPTWIFPDETVGTTTTKGQRFIGETALDTLADWSKCPLVEK